MFFFFFSCSNYMGTLTCLFIKNSTSLAVAGKDFCIVASDTRQSTGYSINSRFSPKSYKLSETSVIAMNGFHADGLTLKKVLDQKLKVNKKVYVYGI